MQDDSTTKCCAKCAEPKPIESFYSDGRGGRASECRQCKLSRMSRRWANDADYRSRRQEQRRANAERRKANGPDIVRAERACSDCDRLLPASSFGRDAGAADGLQGRCKSCACARAAGLRAKRTAGGVAVPASKRCGICLETLPAAEFTTHRSSADGLWCYCRKCDGARRATAKGRAASLVQRWRRIAREKGAAGSASVVQRKARWDYYGGLCWMCHAPAEAIDHVIAVSRGGTNWPANLRPACKKCNGRKHARDWRAFM